MSLQILRIVGVIVGGTLGGYISGKIGEYIYNKKNKLPQIDNSIEINQIPVSSSNEKKKINTFEDILNREVNTQIDKNNTNTNTNTNKIESDSDVYFNDYLKALEDEKKKLQEKELLFINDAIYDNNYYDYILLVAK